MAGIADRAPLDDVFLRRYRDTHDASLGWGHNSQWKTDFRRDYRTATADHLNVDGEFDIDEASAFDPELKSAIREVVRDRYASPEAAARIGERDDVFTSQLAVGVRRDVRWVSSQLGLQVERLLLADVNAMESLDDDRTAQLLLNAEKEVCVLDLISDSGHWPDEAMDQGHANQLFEALIRRSADSSLPVYKRIVQVSDLEAALAGVKAPTLIRHYRDMLELRRVRGHRVSLRVSARRFPFKFMLVDRSRVVLQLQEYDRAGDALKIWGEVLVADDRGEFVEIFREIWAEIDGDDRTRAMTAKDLPPP